MVDRGRNARLWETALRWIAIASATAATYVALTVIGVPSGALFAGLLVGVALALATREPLIVPGPVNTAAQAIIGVVIGGLVDVATLAALGRSWPAVVAVILGTLLLSVIAGVLMGRWTSVSAITGSLSMIAGGAAGVASMSRDLGADERTVSVVQYLRVMLTVSTLPVVTAFLFHPTYLAVTARPSPDGPGLIAGLLFTGVCAVTGILIARLLRVPAGTLLGPLVIAGALGVAGWAQGAATPDWLAQMAYALIGLRIGLGFTRKSLLMIWRVLPVALVLTVAVILGCAGLGLALSAATGLSSLTGYLATSPGGLFAVLAIAVDTGSDPTLVLAVQVLRIFIMLLISPLLAILLSRRRPR